MKIEIIIKQDGAEVHREEGTGLMCCMNSSEAASVSMLGSVDLAEQLGALCKSIVEHEPEAIDGVLLSLICGRDMEPDAPLHELLTGAADPTGMN